MFFSIQIFTAYEIISPGKPPLQMPHKNVHIPSPDIPIQQKKKMKIKLQN